MTLQHSLNLAAASLALTLVATPAFAAGIALREGSTDWIAKSIDPTPNRQGTPKQSPDGHVSMSHTAVHHASILTSWLLSYSVPCSQNRIGSPGWARP